MKRIFNIFLLFLIFFAPAFQSQNDANRLFEKAYKLYQEGKLEDARNILDLTLHRFPSHLPSLRLISRIYIKFKEYDEAIKTLEKIVELNPEDNNARTNLAEVYAWKGEYERAIVLLKDVLKTHPANIKAKIVLARVYRWAQRFDEAELIYREILHQDPQNVEALRGLALVHAFQGQFSSAIRVINKALRLYPENAELYREKGDVLAWEKKFSEAEKVYAQALKLDPRDPNTYHSLGNLYAWTKRYKQSIAAYRKAAQLDPEGISHLIEMARTYMLWHKYSKAIEILSKVLKKDPQNPQALKLYYEANQKKGEIWAEALKKVVEPAVFLFVLSMVWVYFHRRKDIVKRRHRFFWIFYRYILPFVIMFSVGALVLTGFVFSEELQFEAVVEYLETFTLLMLTMAFITILWSTKSPKEKKGKTYLFVGAHPDDIELGCAGLIAKLKDEGAKVMAVVLSVGEKGISSPEKKEIRREEARQAARYLGLDKIFIYDLPDTDFKTNLNLIKDIIEQKIRENSVDVLFTHTIHDTHQDHRAVYEASLTASRKGVSIFCYESVSTTQDFVPNYFVDITEYLEIKIKALKFYKSQLGKPYMNPESIKGRAVHRGLQAGVKYAEAFEAFKLVEK